MAPASTPPRPDLSLGLGDGSPGGAAPRGDIGARIRPMRPTAGAAPFDDPGFLFEPWWPGIPAFVCVDAGVVRLQAAALGDPEPVFLELADLAGLLRADRVVLEATLLVLDARTRPSAELLRRRLDGRASAAATPPPGRAALVATDLLLLDGRSLAGRPFGERRGELAALLRPSTWCLAGHGFVGEGIAVARALGQLGFHWVSAHRLDAPYRPGPAGDAWFRIPIDEPAERRPPPFLAVARRLGL